MSTEQTPAQRRQRMLDALRDDEGRSHVVERGDMLWLLAYCRKLEKVAEAAKARMVYGHNDSCSHESWSCNCGYDAVGEALEAAGYDN